MLSKELLIIIALLVSIIIFVLILLKEISKLHKRINSLLRTSTGGTIEESIKKFHDDFNSKKELILRNDRELNELIKYSKNYFDKFSLVNYNGYGDMGGNMSFIMCILNGENSGFIINSLHSRTGTRIYTKEISKGQYNGTLSEEEKKALLEAAEKIK